MWSLRAVFLLTVSLVYSSHPLFSCTILKVSHGRMTLVGNNEDDNTTDTKIWFLAPERGKYGRVFFGLGDVIQGGMNDQGLFFDWVADNPSDDWTRDPNKLNYAGSVSEKILEEASTVEEALRLYERFNETAFLKSRTMLVDKTGASAIVGWKDSKVKITRGQGKFQAMGYGYGTAVKSLEQMRRPSIKSVRAVLEDCLQRGEYPTQYSNVYDLQRGEIWVYLFHQRKPPIKLNLHDELTKGHHYYNIPRLAEQIKQAAMTDFKTQTSVELDPAICSRYVGRYRIEPDYVFTITNESGRLYVDAHDASHTELYPASETRFFLRSLDSYLLFQPAENGEVNDAILHVRDKDVRAKRVN